jgi:hypothetical protein
LDVFGDRTTQLAAWSDLRTGETRSELERSVVVLVEENLVAEVEKGRAALEPPPKSVRERV